MFKIMHDYQALLADILATPDDELKAELRAAGVQTEPPEIVYADAARRCAMPTDVDKIDIPRPELVESVVQLAAGHHSVVISGSAGSGKSWVLHAALERLRSAYRVSPMLLDGRALQARAPALLSRAALSQLDERGFDGDGTHCAARRKFAAAIAMGDEADAFRRYLSEATALRPVIAIDHVDDLIDDRAAALWLKGVNDAVKERGGVLIVTCRAARFGGRQGRLPRGGYRSRANELSVLLGADNIVCEDFSKTEIHNWLTASPPSTIRFSPSAAGNLCRLLGGRPRLFQSLMGAARSHAAEIIDRPFLQSFAQQEARRYSVECALLISIAREHPVALLNPLQAPVSLRPKLVETGALRYRGDGHLIFSSPVIARRYAWLSRPEQMLWIAARGPALLAPSRPIEIAIEGMAQWFRELPPGEALSMLPRLFDQRGYKELELFVADRENAKLWSQIWPKDKRTGPQPLSRFQDAAFIRAAGEATLSAGAGCKVYMPLIGTMGRAELIVGAMPPPCGVCAQSGQVQEHFALLTGIAPAIALALETLHLRRKDKAQRSLYHRIATVGNSQGNPVVSAAQATNCSAFVVLERGLSSWVVGHVETDLGKGDETDGAEPDWTQLLRSGKASVLNDIARHPSRRGLVLSGSDLTAAFPRLRQLDGNTAAYIHPVWQGSRCRLVIFLFRNASRGISGLTQTELATLAPLAVPGVLAS
jgi:hypothetical protein